MAKSGRPRIQIYIKIFQKCSACYKTIFDSTTNHLNLSLMFSHCLLLDLTVIDLMSIVHIMDNICVLKLQKNLRCRRPGGCQ